ncbi:hypothetical protein ACFL3V_07120 [Nanoarchaeota archaeon]
MSTFMVLLGAVMLGIIVIILIIIFRQIAEASEEEALRTRCKTSLMAYAKIKNLPFGDAQADESAIKCPTKYITIEAESQKTMRRDVANLMVECWSDMGAGKIRLFSAQDEKFCVICSVLKFEDPNTKLTGLSSFMMTEKAPIRIDGRKPTYYEYLARVQTDTSRLIDKAQSTVDNNYLDGGKRYAIMFTYYKQSYWSKLKSALVGSAIFGGAVLVIGTVVGVAVGVATAGTAAPIGAMIIAKSIAVATTLGVAAGGATGVAASDDTSGVTTGGADWDANIILAQYSEQGLKELGCEALPVSQMDERFR